MSEGEQAPMSNVNAVRDALQPKVDPYLSLCLPHTGSTTDAVKRMPMGEALGQAVAALPRNEATLAGLDAYAFALVRLADSSSRLSTPDGLLVVLAMLVEDLRFELHPPPVADGACDCRVRVAFTILSPPPTERLETAEPRTSRCTVCSQFWCEDPPEVAPLLRKRRLARTKTDAAAGPRTAPYTVSGRSAAADGSNNLPAARLTSWAASAGVLPRGPPSPTTWSGGWPREWAQRSPAPRSWPSSSTT